MKKGKFNQLPFEDRFWLSVGFKDDQNACWLWKGYVGSQGYGYIKQGYKTRLAHRVSFELFNMTTLRPGECVCHSCDTPLCVNPHHLWVGTHKSNAEDRNSKGREAHPSGERHPMAKLTEQQVLEILASDETGKALAQRYGVNAGQISNIRNGKSWGHVQSNFRAMGRIAA